MKKLSRTTYSSSPSENVWDQFPSWLGLRKERIGIAEQWSSEPQPYASKTPVFPRKISQFSLNLDLKLVFKSN
jgi:hypothetical protein